LIPLFCLVSTSGLLQPFLAEDGFAVDIEVWLNLTIYKLKSFKAQTLRIGGTTVKSNGFIFWTSDEQKWEFKFITEDAPWGLQLQIVV